MSQDDVFAQLYQALTPPTSTADASMFDEWLKQDFLSDYNNSSTSSSSSSPPPSELATPLDHFLSPTAVSLKTERPACIFDTSVDLDVSAILNSPPTTELLSNTSANTSATATPVVTPITPVPTAAMDVTQQMSHLIADLPAALAALAAIAAPATTAATPAVSPAVKSATTPTFSTRRSTTTSTTKKRALEDIDPTDDAAVKRQKNTDAARRSRLRKMQKMEALETRVSDLEKLNAGLLMRVAVLDSEKTNLKAKESSYESRIKCLEEQLAEAHKALSSR
ncbi:MAG: hypothetical protein EXX96DRAFT_594730 [Benjaminiella poitrasii]|nr:MAG: hypothetical protein EXX96DRAFT_594730 [Benjaminiella poitrasii]